MSVLRVSLNSAACSLRKTLVPHVSSGIRSIWPIPRFHHVSPVVREQRGNWRGCSNQSSGKNNALTDEERLKKLRQFNRLKKALFNNEIHTGEVTDADYTDADYSDEDLSSETVQSTWEKPVWPDRSKADLCKVIKSQNEEILVLITKLSKLEEENKSLYHDIDVFVDAILRNKFKQLLQNYKN